MGWKVVIGLFLVITIVAILTRIVLRRVYEGFQQQGGGALDAQTEAEMAATVAAQERERKIQEIIKPRVDDVFKVEFPRSFVEWAVDKSSSSTTASDIRSDLLNNYNIRLQQFRFQTLQEQSRDAEWTKDPKGETCRQATAARDAYLQALGRLRRPVQDLSGTLYSAIEAKDLNRSYQQDPAIKDKCRLSRSAACIGLATQDSELVKAVPWYEGVNTEIFTKEVEIRENINVLNQILEILDCPTILDKPTLDAATGKTTDPKNLRARLGYMDTPLLRMKLSEMSPYYLSPDVLEFLTRYLIDSEEMNSKIVTLTNLSQDISTNSARLRAFTQ